MIKASGSAKEKKKNKISKRNLLFAVVALLLPFIFYGMPKNIKTQDSLTFTKKIIPKEIMEEAKIALSYYPELKDIPIEFKFKKKIKKSFMQAQPDFSDVFKSKKNRSYNILISKSFNIENDEIDISEVPSEVIIGWIGHELGHIMDYQNRSAMNMLWFGIRYVTSKGFLMNAERDADTFAVNHGMGDFILATKNFILDHAHLSEVYKERIRKLYLSPEEIISLVNKLEENEKKEALEDPEETLKKIEENTL